jgi:hypothetical protein
MRCSVSALADRYGVARGLSTGDSCARGGCRGCLTSPNTVTFAPVGIVAEGTNNLGTQGREDGAKPACATSLAFRNATN